MVWIGSRAVSAAHHDLKQRLAEVYDLERALGVLGWDQRTMMPAQGAAGRAEASATLAGLAHERFVSDEIGRLLDGAAPLTDELDYDSDDASLIRVTRRDWEKAPRPLGANGRLDSRGREGTRRVARGARGERLRRLPARVPARARRRAPLGRAHGEATRRTTPSSTSTSPG